MARKKVTLAWIQKDSARKATYKKRKRGLLKKVSELSTLCGVRVCAIVYGQSETAPEIWPTTTEAVQKILQEFNDLPELEKSKKMLNQEGFMRQRVSKLQEQLDKFTRENAEMELKNKLLQAMQDGSIVNNAGIEEIQIYRCLVEAKMAQLRGRNVPVVSSDAGTPPPMLPHSMPVHLSRSLQPHSIALRSPLAPMAPFPTVLMREEEPPDHLHLEVPLGLYGENNYMDFLVNLESDPSELPSDQDHFNWNYPPPQL